MKLHIRPAYTAQSREYFRPVPLLFVIRHLLVCGGAL